MTRSRRRSVTPCLEPGCGNWVSPPGRCPAHGGRRNVYASAEYKANRRIVMARAKVCAICLKPPTPEDPLTCDHIVAASQGGASTIDNLQAVHDTCNKRKGAAAW